LRASIDRRLWAGLLRFYFVPLLACLPLAAQEQVSAPRADGQFTPLLVYPAAGQSSSCAPLAVISHGAGGSENGYRYLAEFMAHHGFTTVAMGHRESGLAALGSHVRQNGVQPSLLALVTDPQAEKARLLDVGAALKWADSQCHAGFRVLLGHSMGAATVMLEAGARNMIGVASPPAGQDRFDAYVALSPQGPGDVFTKHAWGGIHKPMLILTGTRDQSLQGGPEARQAPWHDLPGNTGTCQWMGVIDGATHMNFAGTGVGADRVGPMVTHTIASFLGGVRGHSCSPPASRTGMMLKAK